MYIYIHIYIYIYVCVCVHVNRYVDVYILLLRISMKTPSLRMTNMYGCSMIYVATHLLQTCILVTVRALPKGSMYRSSILLLLKEVPT